MPPSRAQEDIDPLAERVGELERYLIDLKGYLVVKQALSRTEVDCLNQVIAEQLLPPPTTYNRFGTAPLGSGFLGWHASFVPLVDHPSVIDILQFLLGPLFTLQTIYGIYEDRFVGRKKSSGLVSNSKPRTENELTCRLIWNLTDSGPGFGGFCCVEGSHHSTGEIPASITDDLQRSPYIVAPDAPAGSVIVCTSRLSHGDLTWDGPHQRRSLVFEYTTNRPEEPARRIDLPSFELTRQQISVLGHSNM